MKPSTLDPARIATLLEPFLGLPLRPEQIAQISAYLDLLLRWNARTNLTAIRRPEEIVTRHFGESLFTAQTLFPAPPETPAQLPTASLDLIDLGSGAGFPGIPIQIWAPSLRTTLLESQQKKVAFLREVIRTLTLTNIDVSPARAEDFHSPHEFPTIPDPPAEAAAEAETRAETEAPAEVATEATTKAPTEAAPPLRSSQGWEHNTLRSPTKVRAEKETPARKKNFERARASVVTLRAVERFDQILPVAARLVAPSGRLALLIAATQAATAYSILPTFNWQSPRPLPESLSRILIIGQAPPNQTG